METQTPAKNPHEDVLSFEDKIKNPKVDFLIRLAMLYYHSIVLLPLFAYLKIYLVILIMYSMVHSYYEIIFKKEETPNIYIYNAILVLYTSALMLIAEMYYPSTIYFTWSYYLFIASILYYIPMMIILDLKFMRRKWKSL